MKDTAGLDPDPNTASRAAAAPSACRDEARRRQLFEDGFCRFPNVLPEAMLGRLRNAIARLLVERAAERASQRTTGSMIHTNTDPIFAELIAYPSALAALASLGYPHPTFTDGYIISKPARGPRLFWHYDWFAWETPRAFDPEPMQLFAMYYLSDATRKNGCLRVVPGTHFRENPLHGLIARPHSAELHAPKTLECNPAFSDRPDEVDVCVKAGELLIGDARLLHAAHDNQTDEERMLITLWYQPDYANLPEDIQAQMVAKIQIIPTDWPDDSKALLEPLLPRYTGGVKAAKSSLRPVMHCVV